MKNWRKYRLDKGFKVFYIEKEVFSSDTIKKVTLKM